MSTENERISKLRMRVVRLIMEANPESALKLLSAHYGIGEPSLRVGTVKRHRKVLACYVEREKRIYVSSAELLRNPFVILHEFYHHLRASEVGKSRQAEKRADLFAVHFLKPFRRAS